VSIPGRIRSFLEEIEGQYTRREVAEKLRPKIPDDEWEQWAEENANAAFVRLIGDMDRTRRREGKKALIREAFQTGDPEALDFFRISFEVDDDGRQIRLGDATGPDCRAGAALHRQGAKARLLEAAFLEAIAKKSPNKPRSEIYTEAQLRAMYESIVGRAA